jgi:hypothetical protein
MIRIKSLDNACSRPHDLLSIACGTMLLQSLFRAFWQGFVVVLEAYPATVLITAQEGLINVKGNAPVTQFLLHLADDDMRTIWWCECTNIAA